MAAAIRRCGLLLAALFLAIPPARACQACFGADDSPMIDGARIGVWVLLGVTLCVQLAFAGFFLYLRQRAKRISSLEVDEEWSKLQHTTGRS